MLRKLNLRIRAETYVLNIVVPVSSNRELHNALLKLSAISSGNHSCCFVFGSVVLQSADCKADHRNQRSIETDGKAGYDMEVCDYPFR